MIVAPDTSVPWARSMSAKSIRLGPTATLVGRMEVENGASDSDSCRLRASHVNATLELEPELEPESASASVSALPHETKAAAAPSRRTPANSRAI